MTTSPLPNLPFPPKSSARRDVLARKKYLTAVNDLAAQRFLAGDVKGSWELAEPFFAFEDECPYLAELHAAHLLQQGQPEQALGCIELAVTNGFEHAAALRSDPTYASLHAHPRWVQLFRDWDERGFVDTGYRVGLEALAAEGLPPLLKAFGLLLRKTPYGAFGYFDFDERDRSELSPTARPFLLLGDGSEVALEPDGSVVVLSSDGEPTRKLAPDLRAFLELLAAGATSVHELDSDKQNGAGRGALRDFLKSQS